MNKENEDHPSRQDDKFLRRILWLSIAIAMGSSGGWFYSVAYSHARFEQAIERIEKLELIQAEISRSMSSIDKGVAVLVANSETRNELLREWRKKQEYIFGEQKRRKPLIDWVEKQMTKR